MEENGKPTPQRKAAEGAWRPHDRRASPGAPLTASRAAASPPSQAEAEESETLSRLKILRGVLIGCVTVVGLLVVGVTLINLLWYLLFR